MIYYLFSISEGYDENGPIGKLNKITDRIGNSFYVDYGSGNIKDHISTAIDTLDNDNRLHIGIIATGTMYVCLAQKYGDSTHASGLVFGYNADKLLYQRKVNGTWGTIREI